MGPFTNMCQSMEKERATLLQSQPEKAIKAVEGIAIAHYTFRYFGIWELFTLFGASFIFQFLYLIANISVLSRIHQIPFFQYAYIWVYQGMMVTRKMSRRG